jgi:DNA-directed RNA polymerase II subunit RPB9
MNQEFCRECNNMLYPKEEKQERQLYMACRNCEHFEEAVSNRVYFNRISVDRKEASLSTLSKDLAKDPTLPRSRRAECPKCKTKEAAYFQTRDRQQDVALTIYFVCCSCFHIWSGINES